MAKSTKSGLGRGLNSLLGGYYEEPSPQKEEKKKGNVKTGKASTSETVENTEEVPQRVVVESSDLQEVLNSEIAAERLNTQKTNAAIEATPKKSTTLEAEQASNDKKSEQAIKTKESEQEEKPGNTLVDELPLDSISPNPDQPRTNFKQEELEELATSIQKDGLLQPIVVRLISEGKYQIIAGERRWQACKYLKMEKVPVRIYQADEDKALELALIENIQRSDLNPIEEAYGYRRLMERMNLTQSEVAQVVSKGRSTIANALRLLELPEDAQQLLYEEKISAGHARAILSIPTPDGRQKLTKKLKEEKLSVRETEAIARLLSGKINSNTSSSRTPTPSSFKKVAKSLRKTLKTNVKVKTVQGKNKIEIEFKDEDDLQRLFMQISSVSEEE